MSTFELKMRPRIVLAACIGALAPWSLVHAEKTINEQRSADPQGEVEIITVAGSVQIEGWSRDQVEVSGSIGDGVERVDVSSAGKRTSIHVVSRSAHGWGSEGEANLVVHVPQKSAVSASLVSADCKLKGVQGSVKLQSVSGRITAEAQGDVRATTVSGEVQLTARTAKNIEVKTISGDIDVKGGGGEVSVTTISGAAKVELAQVSRGHFKSISGDMNTQLALDPDGEYEGESVSGDISVKLAGSPAAQFDVQTISGDIENCSGPKPVESRYGPGSRLQYTNGTGSARVHVNTKSGDVQLCSK
jgi:DUF4097 and DUF4098 domain-containing protein YvlB